MLLVWSMYVTVGLAAGLVAGLLGVGGGILIVPLLNVAFAIQGMPAAHIQHLALGTSLATIIFTSISSFRAHHRRGAVNWRVVGRIAPGILTGTLAGAWLASYLSTRFLRGFFALFLFYVALQMLLDIRPKGSRDLPEAAGMFGTGNVIGAVSSLVGIGGGSLSVPFLVWCNMPMHNAIGTSAAIGFPLAVFATAGYVLSGLRFSANLPHLSLGFVYLPALVGISAASVLTAPLGARLAHSLPVGRLKQVFAVLLSVVGLKMLLSVL